MTRLVICFSADIEALRNNRLFDADISARFPGATWVSCLLKQNQWSAEFLTADVALSRVKGKLLDARNILVIQHNFDPECDELIASGATLFLLTMFESPLYASSFYDKLLAISARTRWLLTYEGLSQGVLNNLHAYFPAFGISDLKSSYDAIPWKDRKYASMVVGNKYVLTQAFGVGGGPEFIVWWFAKAFRQCVSRKSVRLNFSYMTHQLQDRRLEIIEQMLKRGQLHLYGSDWDKLYRIPPVMRKRIAPLISDIKVSPVSDKKLCLSFYKFNICFENFSAPSYITEKIFDAMIARTVPVYLGSQNISNYLPSGAFIDASKFESMSALADYLETVSERDAKDIICAGQDFLRSDGGLQYSYEAMASRVAGKLKQFLDDAAG